jgi:outer membrane protein assembly factor BamB
MTLRHCLYAVVGLAAAIATTIAAPNARDYSQWRGQNRDGSASSFAAPGRWPEKLTRKWKVDVGVGYATPLVAGNAVYCFTRQGGSEVMTALNSKSGKIVWQTRYPASYSMFAAARLHGEGPKATPLFHNNRLFTLGISGIVSAFDPADGKLMWQQPAPAEQPFYGTAASPVGYGDLVIVHPGNYGPLTAFNAATGKVKWTANGDGAFASPIVADLSGTHQIVAMTQKHVIGVSPADGAVLWQHPWSPDMQTITPVLAGDAIVLSGHNAGVTAIRPTNRDGKWTVDVVWQTKDVSMFMSNPVVIHDTMFGLSHRSSGQFFALDTRNGKILWLGEPREATNTAVVKAGNLLFLLNDDAELIVARSSVNGFEPLKRYTVAESATWAQPVISGNRVFIKDVSSVALWALN